MKTSQTEYVDIPCPLCLGENFSTIFQPDEAKLQSFTITPEVLQCTSPHHLFFMRLARCKRCSMVMINPQPEEKLLLELAINIDDDIYDDEKKAKIRTAEKTLEKVNRIHPPSDQTRYLDFSCYSGLFVETLLQQNKNAVGIDICPKMITKGNHRLKKEVLFSGPMENWDEILGNRKFDVITSWDAIEHIPSPMLYLQKARQLLEDQGTLVVATMNYASLFARLCGRRWPWLMPMHLYYFTPETLTNALSQSGFQVIHRTTYSHYTSLGYLLYKASPNSLGRWRNAALLKNLLLPVNLGDFMTLFAKKV